MSADANPVGDDGQQAVAFPQVRAKVWRATGAVRWSIDVSSEATDEDVELVLELVRGMWVDLHSEFGGAGPE